MSIQDTRVPLNERTKVDTDYLNKKMESMMSAFFESIGEYEERVKNLEKIIFELKQNGS
jgi:hypothetical protein